MRRKDTYRKYVCVNMPSDLNEKQDMIDLNVSIGILKSLMERGLLNYEQYSRCVNEMRKKYKKQKIR